MYPLDAIRALQAGKRVQDKSGREIGCDPDSDALFFIPWRKCLLPLNSVFLGDLYELVPEPDAEARLKEVLDLVGEVCPWFFRHDPVDGTVECGCCGNGASTTPQISHRGTCPVGKLLALLEE